MLLSSFVRFHVRDHEFPSILERFRFTTCRCCNQTPAKKQHGEKRKANAVYEKQKANRKWQDSWTWAAIGEEHLWLTNDEARSGIGDRRDSLQVGGNLGPRKVHSVWTLHQDCAGKEGPKSNWWSPTWEVAYATVARESDSSEQRMPLLRSQGRTRTSITLVGGGERERESETNLSHLFVSLYDFPSMEKKIWNRVDCWHSEKKIKNTQKVKQNAFLIRQNKMCILSCCVWLESILFHLFVYFLSPSP